MKKKNLKTYLQLNTYFFFYFYPIPFLSIFFFGKGKIKRKNKSSFSSYHSILYSIYIINNHSLPFLSIFFLEKVKQMKKLNFIHFLLTFCNSVTLVTPFSKLFSITINFIYIFTKRVTKGYKVTKHLYKLYR